VVVDWDNAYAALASALGLGPNDPAPPIPRPTPTSISSLSSLPPAQLESGREKRKLTEGEREDESKRTKAPVPPTRAEDGPEIARPLNQLPPLLSVLHPSDVAHPVMPTKAELEQVLLDLRKRALLEEYVGAS
jgi:pre-mRNA-splicing factor ISY1